MQFPREIEKHFKAIPFFKKRNTASRALALLKMHSAHLAQKGTLPEALELTAPRGQADEYVTHTAVSVKPIASNVKVVNLPKGMSVEQARDLALDYVEGHPDFKFDIKGKPNESAITKKVNAKYYKLGLRGGSAKRFTHAGVTFHVGKMGIESRNEASVAVTAKRTISSNVAVKIMKNSPDALFSGNAIAHLLARKVISNSTREGREEALHSFTTALEKLTKA